MCSLISYLSPSGGLLLPPQGYTPPPLWGMTMPPHHHQSQPFYGGAGTFPGAARPQAPAASLPIGSHNQFIPLQVNTHIQWQAFALFVVNCSLLFVFML